MSLRLYAVCLPGLEPLLRQELQALGATLVEGGASEAGGVEFETPFTGLYRANMYLRTANRIILRFSDFYASTFSELRTRVSRLPWEQYIKPGQTVAVRASTHRSKLYHTSAIAERIAGGIQDRLGKPIQVVKFDEEAQPVPQLVMARLFLDQCAISLDTSGELLSRRGYRLETAKAPLRETFAAGLLLQSGWNPSKPLLDPFCGSGTIPIEAALLASKIAPGKKRHFAFMGWPGYDSKLWSGLVAEAISQERPALAPIQASDRDAGAIRIAQENAARAGVLDRIEFCCRPVSAIEPPAEPGWVVTNPPYGVRVSPAHDLRNLYAQLGNVLRAKCPDWQVGLLCNDRALAGQAQLGFGEPLRLVNGGIPVGFYQAAVGRQK
jgi:putative N6-adenine-specific DNA methylase